MQLLTLSMLLKPWTSLSILSDSTNFIISVENMVGDFDPGIRLTDLSHSD
jgi:hypothetical protein